MSELTREQKRIRIAEACGWNMDPPESHGWNSRGRWCKSPSGELMFAHAIPDYFGSLDAMAEARKSLTPDQQVQFSVELGRLATSHLPASRAAWMDFYIADASAAQHAEAFGKTLKLW